METRMLLSWLLWPVVVVLAQPTTARGHLSAPVDYDTLRPQIVHVRRLQAMADADDDDDNHRKVVSEKEERLQRTRGFRKTMTRRPLESTPRDDENQNSQQQQQQQQHEKKQQVEEQESRRELIQGGETAQPGRYPYLTVLYNSGKTLYKCVATLIAPDLLLASATCATTRIANGIVYPLVRVGVRNGPFDDFGPVSQDELLAIHQIVVHPDFRQQPAQQPGKQFVPNSKDLAIISLFGKSTTRAPVRLNIRARRADGSKNSNFTILGWGQQFPSTGPARNLQQQNVQLMSPELCRETVPALEDVLTNDMICASAKEGGVCNLDLGNPLMEISSNNAKDDLQMGVVSFYTPFGETCSQLGAPVAFTNVLQHSDWIRREVCHRSFDPPRYFRCDNPRTPLVPGNATEFITVQITMDCCPNEIGWLLQTFAGNGNVLASVRPGEYASLKEGDVVTETFEVNVDMVYRFVLMDDFGDGLDFLSGDYRIYRGRDAQSGTLLLSYGGTDFDFTHVLEKRFLLGSFETAAPTIGPTEAPTAETTPPPTPALSAVPSFVIDDTLPYLQLTILLDSFPEETGWTVRDVDTQQVVAQREIGSYAKTPGGERVVERINLGGPEEGWKSYQFDVLDSAKDGLCCLWGQGSYQFEFVAQGQVTFEYKGSGQFSDVETIVFAVIWTADKTCRQDDEAEFVFKSNSVRTCLWLGKRKRPRIQKICARQRRFTAHEICPKTCGTCQTP